MGKKFAWIAVALLQVALVLYAVVSWRKTATLNSEIVEPKPLNESHPPQIPPDAPPVSEFISWEPGPEAERLAPVDAPVVIKSEEKIHSLVVIVPLPASIAYPPDAWKLRDYVSDVMTYSAVAQELEKVTGVEVVPPDPIFREASDQGLSLSRRFYPEDWPQIQAGRLTSADLLVIWYLTRDSLNRRVLAVRVVDRVTLTPKWVEQRIQPILPVDFAAARVLGREVASMVIRGMNWEGGYRRDVVVRSAASYLYDPLWTEAKACDKEESVQALVKKYPEAVEPMIFKAACMPASTSAQEANQRRLLQVAYQKFEHYPFAGVLKRYVSPGAP